MKSYIILPLILVSFSARSQFKNDNVSYKTIDPAGLCDALKMNSGFLMLDVRSPGEYSDTSGSAGYNLGHFKDAVNINVRDLGKRINEISAYRDKPVFVYCSHSQRSRRASKMLADSGFTNVFNINGGMSSFYYRDLDQKDCISGLLQTKNTYKIISFNELGELRRTHRAHIIDVRPDSAFRHITKDPKINAYGIVKGAVNIPLEKLEPGAIGQTRQAHIIVTDLYGDDAAKAANRLSKDGYVNVYMLIEGIDRVLFTNHASRQFPEDYVSPVTYQLVTATEFGELVSGNTGITLLDVRTNEEFNNKHKDGWRNIGHIKHAVHIPADSVSRKLTELDRTKPIVVYGVGSGPEVHGTAELLQKNGFRDVKVLVGGLFNLRWTSGNVKGQGQLANLVVDVPEINL